MTDLKGLPEPQINVRVLVSADHVRQADLMDDIVDHEEDPDPQPSPDDDPVPKPDAEEGENQA